MRLLFLFLLFIILFSCKNNSYKSSLVLAQEQETKPKAYALLIGIEETRSNYPPSIYHNLDPYVDEFFSSFESILEDRGFEKDNIEGIKNAKAREVKKKLKKYLRKLEQEDLFVFYFFGHGDQIEDEKPYDEKCVREDDIYDECFVANDEIILDDEIYKILSKTNSKGNIVFISESCYSGSMLGYRPRVIESTDFIPSWDTCYPDQPNLIYLGAATDIHQATPGLYKAIKDVWDKSQSYPGGPYIEPQEENYIRYFEMIHEEYPGCVMIENFASKKFLNKKFLKN